MNQRALLKKFFANPLYWIALGFGAGLMPFAPGTWGTLVSVPLYFIFIKICSPVMYYCVLIVSFLLGIFICHVVAQDLNKQDPKCIVWDEILGYWITMLFAPPGMLWMGIGFLLFRLFDVWKPYPIRYFDRKIHGGLGIMLDDVIAALFAGISIRGLAILWSLIDAGKS